MNRLSTDRSSTKLESIEQFFSQDVALFTRRLNELEAQIDPTTIPQVNDSYHLQVLDAFNQSQAACRLFETNHGDDPVLIKDVQEGFRKETNPWFDKSWIANRARTKPNGFAGDYEMLIKLYEEATPARGLGGYLDLCILDLPLARAVRTRLRGIREFLIEELNQREGDVRILDIASGPCWEYVNWPTRQSNGNVEIVAMDNDPRALDYVDTTVANALDSRTELRAIRYNALRTRAAHVTTAKFGKFDIIYSVGLCDYLSDEQLIAIFGGLRETLADGGVLYIAFKDTLQYDKTPYQWHLDWFFFQRTKEDCIRLFQEAGFDTSAMEISRDATNIIINFVSRKSRQFVRTDLPVSGLQGHAAQISDPTPRVIENS